MEELFAAVTQSDMLESRLASHPPYLIYVRIYLLHVAFGHSRWLGA